MQTPAVLTSSLSLKKYKEKINNVLLLILFPNITQFDTGTSSYSAYFSSLSIIRRIHHIGPYIHAVQLYEFINIPKMTELDFRDVGQKRFCWVCFGTEQDDQDSNVVWICPCQCKGTMKWVHEDCLQRWIDEKQKGANSPRVNCSQCRTCYVLSFPPINCLVKLMEQYDKLLYGSSPFVAG